MKKSKIIFWICLILVLVLGGLFFFRFYFVFGEGVKAGDLNQCVYKGVVWKTYEGRLIQTGFKGAGKGSGTIQSNEFNFSVKPGPVADSLMRCSGKSVELHYKEYFAPLPWRGHSRYVVDGILSVGAEADPTNFIPIVGEE